MKALLTTLLVISALTYIGYNNMDTISNNVNFLQNARQTLFGLDSCLAGCKFQCGADDHQCLAASNFYYAAQYSNQQCLDFWKYHDSHDAVDPVPESWYVCQQKAKPANMGQFANRYNCIVKCGN